MVTLENNAPELEPNRDRWRSAILAERRKGTPHPIMEHALSFLQAPRRDALILGDASLVQSRYLIERVSFESVTDVDSSPTLLDDFYDNERLKKVLSDFSDYQPPAASFDFIYGKSIAFMSKENITEYLQILKNSLRGGGLFAAVWAKEEDSFRKDFYSAEELDALYKASGFEIVEMIDIPAQQVNGLVRPGTKSIIEVIAR